MHLPSFLERLEPEVYNSDSYTVVDFEVATNHGDFGRPIYPDNQLLLACWRTPEGLVKECWGNELEQQELIDDIERSSFVVAHNAIYELGWLRRASADISKILPFDTQLAEYVLLGNLVSGHADSGIPPVSISLDSCAKRRGWIAKDPVVDTLMGHGINPALMPRKWLADRCKQDVGTTHALFKHQRESLTSSGRLSVMFTRCLLVPVLADIQAEGMQLDGEAVRQTYADYEGNLLKSDTKLKGLTGGINLASSKQLGEYVYDKLGFAEKCDRRGNPIRTETGKRSTGIKVLDTLVASTAEQKQFLTLHKERSKLAAAISKNLGFFKGVCEEAAGVFYADFNQTRTATHRLSSSGIPSVHGSVQFQNFPKAFKRLFRAKRADWLIAETDGSQLEFRVAGYLGQDKQIMEDLSNPDFDAHITSGSEKEGIAYAELLARYRSGDKKAKAIRDAAKPDTFKPLYGGTKGTKKQERWYKAFTARYKGLAEVQSGWVSAVLRAKELITPWGLRYYFPHARMSPGGYCNVTTSVYNYPIQALATAEIIPIALVFLWHRLRATGLSAKVRMVNTVHDSVVCEIAPDVQDEYRQLAQECFTTDVYTYLKKVYNMDFNVPLGANTNIASHWGEGKE